MRIAQVVIPGASQYERKSQRVDQAALEGRHEVVVVPLAEARSSGAAMAHLYASGQLAPRDLIGFPLPYVAGAPLKRSRWRFRQPPAPKAVLTPFELPEAVEETWFTALDARTFDGNRSGGSRVKVIGTFARQDVRPLVEQTLHRIERTRDDIRWRLFEQPPGPGDLTDVDVWVDPAVSENDYDGFVAEALVSGLPVVATRTAINVHRLEKGRTGMLVPHSDPNEMTHAILSALFKPEVASNKVAAARQTVSRFRARQRLRVLVHLYETLVK